MKAPTVIANPVANRHALDGERIIEIDSDAGGLLISLRVRNGRLIVEPYRADTDVRVRVDGKDLIA